MNDIPEGVRAYFAISAVVALCVHSQLHQFFTACLACFFLGPAAFMIVCIVRGENFSSAPPVAVALFFATISLLIALVIGLPFRFVRFRNRLSKSERMTR